MATALGLTRRERKKRITKESLLAVALEIISKQGIYVTTIEDVTEKADVGKGTFYQYFSDKNDLLQQLLKKGLDSLITECRSSLQGVKAAKTAVRTLVKVHIEFLTAHDSYLLLFHQVRGYLQLKHPVAINLRKVYSQHLLDLAGLLTPFFGKTASGAAKSRETAVSLAAYSTGLTTHYHLFHRTLGLSLKKEIIEGRITAALL